tara:strand:- start:396 stop:608 length:213 start_codon:yes stop_codon:yes gene_type:complete
MSKNQINISIDVSDELLNKFVGAMIKMNSMSSMGALPMMLGGMLPPPSDGEKEEKEPMGFRSPNEKAKCK